MAIGLRDSTHEDELVEHHEINVTPFIDVMLVLLIIFMVAAPLATVDLPVDLPGSSASARPEDAQPIYLTVGADRAWRVGETVVAHERLKGALEEASRGDHDQRIYVRADKRAPYEDVVTAMDALREAGYLKVALVGVGQGGS